MIEAQLIGFGYWIAVAVLVGAVKFWARHNARKGITQGGTATAGAHAIPAGHGQPA